MPSLLDPGAYHIISYGTLLGTSIFNTFLTGPISFFVLPRGSFSQLQQRLFPYYFGLQTVLPLGCLIAPLRSTISTTPSLSSLLSAPPSSAQFQRTTAPLLGMSLLGALNWAWIGPWTTRVMRERKRQETRDGKKYDAPGLQSLEMQALNRSFSWLHSISSLLNLVDLGVMLWYGFLLADRIV